MYIKKLELSNFQVIEKFEREFEGNVYFVTGDNELGKSTLLKAIGILLTGERDEVLRNGTDKGFAKMIVGDDGEEFDVELKFTEKNPRGTLTIKQKSSGMQTDNVTMLQKIFGYQDFDAVEFASWSETAEGRRKQIAVVKSLLPADIIKEIEDIDSKVADLKSERTGVNRDVKTFGTLCDNAKKNCPADMEQYSKPMDIAYLMEQQKQQAQLIEKAKSVRMAKEQRTKELSEISNRVEYAKEIYNNTLQDIDTEVEEAKRAYEKAVEQAKISRENAKKNLDERLESIESDRQDIQRRLDNCNTWLTEYEKSNPENNDTEKLLNEAKVHNERHNAVKEYNEKKKQYDEVKAKADKLDAELDDLSAKRNTIINHAQLPIEGLSFTEEGITLNGIPFADGHVSDSQKMEVACRLIIAANPNIRVFRIARGESLGKKRLQTIIDIAKKNDFQGFIESVVRGQEDMRVEEYTES